MDDVKIGEILEPETGEKGRKREENVRAEFWNKLKRSASMIPFVDEVVAAYYCALDRETPHRVRGILLASLAYFILPLDSIPDFILGLGFTDDIAVLTTAITMVRGHITDAHRAAAKEALTVEDDLAA